MMTPPELPTGRIGWIVDRYPVSLDAAAVRADILRRAIGPDWTPRLQIAAIRYALARHRANRRLYALVTGSM